MLKRMCKRTEDESGFSLPEVLVVVMIIGALAGIAAPSFVCQKQKADDSRLKAQARAAASAMEVYANDNLGAYDGATGTILNSINSEVPINTVVVAGAGCPSDTCYSVESPLSQGGQKFKLTKKPDGRLLSDCTPKGDSGCPSNGKWSAE